MVVKHAYGSGFLSVALKLKSGMINGRLRETIFICLCKQSLFVVVVVVQSKSLHELIRRQP